MNSLQEELINKFNAAFYDAQAFDSSELLTCDELDDVDANERFLLENLDESFFTSIHDADNFLLPASDATSAALDVPRLECLPGADEGFSEGFASELVTPSSDCTSTFDYDDFSEHFDQFNHGALPPANASFRQCNWEFSRFLRHQDSASLHYHQLSGAANDFGHAAHDDRSSSSSLFDSMLADGENLMVLSQSDALLLDEGELGACAAPRPDGDDAGGERAPRALQCQWSNCYQVYDSQPSLVRHIEKAHVEVKRGDEFTCFWHECPRKAKPFNARYKLLIHMRVHSGEKPNKCPFSGCNKAFSRLENLKIHQRSHTGERPYLCQFPTCTKSFSNSSDRAKHQRTHFDTKPYACQIRNCSKKYTDPSSLRKHVKNHTAEEQLQLKSRNASSLEDSSSLPGRVLANFATPCDQRAPLAATMIKEEARAEGGAPNTEAPSVFYANYEHDYTPTRLRSSFDVKRDLKNRLSEKLHRNIAHK